MRKKIFRGIPNWYEELCCYIGHAAIGFYLIMIIGGILTCIVNKVCNKSEEESKTEESAKEEPTIILKQILADKPAQGVATATAGTAASSTGTSTGTTAPVEPEPIEPEPVEPDPVEPETEVPEETEPIEPVEPETPSESGTHQTIPIDTTVDKKSSSSSAIPIIAGIAAAGAAGIGTKIYLDRKSNNDNGEDDSAVS